MTRRTLQEFLATDPHTLAQTGILITKTRKEETTENFVGQDLQDVRDWMQGSLETPLRGDPKAAPWEQWETLEHKNKPARLNPPKGVRPV
jgi:hypothetical protein